MKLHAEAGFGGGGHEVLRNGVSVGPLKTRQVESSGIRI